MRTIRPRVIRRDLPVVGRTPTSPVSEDSLLSAIIKWIPVEIIGVYEFISGLIPKDQYNWIIATALLLLIVSPVWVFLSTSDDGKSPAWRQTIIAPIAFAVWITSIDPNVTAWIPGWEGWMGSFTLAIGTLLLPIIDEILKRVGITQN